MRPAWGEVDRHDAPVRGDHAEDDVAPRGHPRHLARPAWRDVLRRTVPVSAHRLDDDVAPRSRRRARPCPECGDVTRRRDPVCDDRRADDLRGPGPGRRRLRLLRAPTCRRVTRRRPPADRHDLDDRRPPRPDLPRDEHRRRRPAPRRDAKEDRAPRAHLRALPRPRCRDPDRRRDPARVHAGREAGRHYPPPRPGPRGLCTVAPSTSVRPPATGPCFRDSRGGRHGEATSGQGTSGPALGSGPRAEVRPPSLSERRSRPGHGLWGQGPVARPTTDV